MVKVQYDARLIFDYSFFEWLNKLDELKQKNIKKYLMHIKASSLDHKRNHNVILKKHYDEIVSNNLINKDLLGAFVKYHLEPEFLNGYDEITQVVKYGIELTNSSPFKTIILTSPYSLNKYLENSHFKKTKSIEARADSSAVDLLSIYFRDFSDKKELYR